MFYEFKLGARALLLSVLLTALTILPLLLFAR
jgi:hypothetical protein